ncbi:unnamed protein product [Larinioides sclopetarius]|uniref:Uncharacterized protein n=1 Tax=Larinioides sclopetarius TaxID=280406 RepID=A0AAV1ZKG8_9ARAC
MPWKCLKRALPLYKPRPLHEYEFCIQFIKIGSNNCCIFKYSQKDDG